jgi:hypothetical protein
MFPYVGRQKISRECLLGGTPMIASAGVGSTPDNAFLEKKLLLSNDLNNLQKSKQKKVLEREAGGQTQAPAAILNNQVSVRFQKLPPVLESALHNANTLRREFRQITRSFAEPANASPEPKRAEDLAGGLELGKFKINSSKAVLVPASRGESSVSPNVGLSVKDGQKGKHTSPLVSSRSLPLEATATPLPNHGSIVSPPASLSRSGANMVPLRLSPALNQNASSVTAVSSTANRRNVRTLLVPISGQKPTGSATENGQQKVTNFHQKIREEGEPKTLLRQAHEALRDLPPLASASVQTLRGDLTVSQTFKSRASDDLGVVERLQKPVREQQSKTTETVAGGPLNRDNNGPARRPVGVSAEISMAQNKPRIESNTNDNVIALNNVVNLGNQRREATNNRSRLVAVSSVNLLDLTL